MQHVEFFDKEHFESRYHRTTPLEELAHFIDFFAHLTSRTGDFDHKSYGYYDYSHFYKHLRKFLKKSLLENLHKKLVQSNKTH